MANKIVQRLIAAGASPARAQAFATQFAKSMPGKRPQDIQDAFDAELASLSQAFFPNTFRPPAPEDPRFLDYAIGVYGLDQIQTIIKDAFAKNAPTYTAAKNGTPYEQKIAKDVAAGKSIVQIQAQILQDFKAELPDLVGELGDEDSGFPVVKLTEDKVTAASNYASKLFNEYKKAEGLSLGSVKNFLNTNKYYKAQLPDPKLKYGKEEDLSAGVISWRTHPQVEKALNSPEVTRAKAISQTAPAGYIGAGGPEAIKGFDKMRTDARNVEENLFNEFVSSKANPFKDEVIRRESLKKKTLK